VRSEAIAEGALKPHPIDFDIGSDGADKTWATGVFENDLIPDGDVPPVAPEGVAINKAVAKVAAPKKRGNFEYLRKSELSITMLT
jgi:hypothetical protein